MTSIRVVVLSFREWIQELLLKTSFFFLFKNNIGTCTSEGWKCM